MRRSKQLELQFPERKRHGGARKGAGRKRKGERARVSHERKAGFKKLAVLHITCKLLPGLGSLRDPRIAAILMAYLDRCCEARLPRRGGFRIVEFSIQGNHVHLICEAKSQEELSRAMQGLMSGMARTVNRELGRKGTIFADRYHAESISSPTQCRNALLYVLANGKKHGVLHRNQQVDPWSTAAWFPFTGADKQAAGSPPGPKPAAAPQSWLLRVGWRRGGSIYRHDQPKCPQTKRRSPRRSNGPKQPSA
jgi:REP-associated tyrosine transposase